jgi:hypothetical protein
MHTLALILAIYAWAAVGMLLFFLGRIAYFYQKTSGQRVGYYLLVIPALLLAAGAVWYLTCDVGFTGQPIADLLLFSGGVLLGLFGARLHTLMTGERQ